MDKSMDISMDLSMDIHIHGNPDLNWAPRPSRNRWHAILRFRRHSPFRSVPTLVDCDHIGWNSSEIISPLVIA